MISPATSYLLSWSWKSTTPIPVSSKIIEMEYTTLMVANFQVLHHVDPAKGRGRVNCEADVEPPRLERVRLGSCSELEEVIAHDAQNAECDGDEDGGPVLIHDRSTTPDQRVYRVKPRSPFAFPSLGESVDCGPVREVEPPGGLPVKCRLLGNDQSSAQQSRERLVEIGRANNGPNHIAQVGPLHRTAGRSERFHDQLLEVGGLRARSGHGRISGHRGLP